MNEQPEDPAEPTTSRGSWFGTTVRKLAIDIAPLRESRDYRLLWSASLVAETGYQLILVTMFVQVYRLTGSAAAVGSIGLVQLVPLILASVGGGSIIDAVDRRKTLIASNVGFAIAFGILLAGAVAGRPPLALVYGAAALTAAIQGIEGPTHSAMTPRLVGTQLMPAAAALNQVAWNATGLFGPALAGLVIARLGLAWSYGLGLGGMAAAVVGATLIRPMPPQRDENEDAPTGWKAVKEGFAYLRGRRVLQSTFAIDLVAMIFGMPRALFAILAVTQFHGGPEITGLLFAAPAAGALVGALTTGWVGGVRHQGRAVIVAVAIWGAGIVAFGTIGDHLWPALVFLAIAGGADVISAVFRSTILQLSVPDVLRGRLSGIHILVVTGGPRLGDFEAGIVAQAFTPAISVVSGGVLCIVGTALLAWLVPEFRRYHAGGET